MGPRADTQDGKPPDLKRWAILLVEDNEEDVLLLRRAFQHAHIANPLIVVKDGEHAINYLSGAGDYGDRARYPLPFLVLLDLRLPKISGFTVLEWIREELSLDELIVVILTGSEHAPDLKAAFELGANSYLIKSANFNDLVDVMRRIKGRWLRRDPIPEKAPADQSPPAE